MPSGGKKVLANIPTITTVPSVRDVWLVWYLFIFWLQSHEGLFSKAIEKCFFAYAVDVLKRTIQILLKLFNGNTANVLYGVYINYNAFLLGFTRNNNFRSRNNLDDIDEPLNGNLHPNLV